MAKILVVDDDKTILLYLDAVLTPAGHVVLAAKNLEELDEVLAQGPPDLTLLDLRLPGPGAPEYARRIRECCPPGGPILIHSGYPDEYMETARTRIGAEGTLAKGLAPDELQASLEAYLTKAEP